MQLEITDTLPAFMDWWDQTKDAALQDQLDSWSLVYMAAWPDLRQKQIEQYTSEGSDWRKVAEEQVLPGLNARLDAMRRAHANLLANLEPVLSLAGQRLGEFQPPKIVVYVGLGLGAGWATDYQGQPALLFGLENIAEEGWQELGPLRGLIAHELGHLLHEQWRQQEGLALGEGPLWQLYCEGFAQRCEQHVLGEDSWHMNGGASSGDWLAWCHNHRGWLAAEFQRRLAGDQDLRAFFGSWHALQGHKQTGYFLGCELIKQLETESSLSEIACLGDVEERMEAGLLLLASTAGQA